MLNRLLLVVNSIMVHILGDSLNSIALNYSCDELFFIIVYIFIFGNENNHTSTFRKRYYSFFIFEKEGKIEFLKWKSFFLSLDLNNYRIWILEGIRFFLIRYDGGLRINSCHLIKR